MHKIRKDRLPYYIIIFVCLLTAIFLLIFKQYYPSLFFSISVIPAFFTPLFFSYKKGKKEEFKTYLIMMILRLLFLVSFSVFYPLLWYYIKVFNSNIHPLFLLVFPFTSLAYYFIVIIKQILSSKKDELR